MALSAITPSAANTGPPNDIPRAMQPQAKSTMPKGSHTSMAASKEDMPANGGSSAAGI